MTNSRSTALIGLLTVLAIIAALQRYSAGRKPTGLAATTRPLSPGDLLYGSRIGADSERIRRQQGKTYVWATGEIGGEDTEWFDLSGAPMEPGEFQYGIGKDNIAAIDEPQFVGLQDPRLTEQNITDDTPVIGYAHAGQARAYPVHILDRHELVNDRVGGKPVTIGW